MSCRRAPRPGLLKGGALLPSCASPLRRSSSLKVGRTARVCAAHHAVESGTRPPRNMAAASHAGGNGAPRPGRPFPELDKVPYFYRDMDRDTAEALLKRESLQGSGGDSDGAVYLVRGSGSRSDCVTLSLTHGGGVSHCRITISPDGTSFRAEGDTQSFPTLRRLLRYLSRRDVLPAPLGRPLIVEGKFTNVGDSHVQGGAADERRAAAVSPHPADDHVHVQPSGNVKRLLPGGQMPECALLWVEKRNAKWQEDVAACEKQMRPAAEWALDALCHAHEDKRLKKAVRRLLAVSYFTAGLNSSRDILFDKVLRPGLRKRLVELSRPLANAFDNADLSERLSDEVVAEAIGRPDEHPLAAARARSGQGGRPTQIDVLPCVDRFVDFTKPETFPDEVYAQAVLMVAAALDVSFQATVARAVREHNTAWECATGNPGTARHEAAPAKAIARVITKVRSDYKHDATPRAQHNVDVVRCLVTADTPEELLTLSGRLVQGLFGGVVRVKNLFSASAEERAERFHLLPLMLTVQLGAEGGATFGSFVRQPEVKAALSAYVAAREVTLPPHRWRETTALAQKMLESEELSGVPVGLLGELQMVLTEDAKVRHAMHEVYKAYRAESPALLWEDYARTAMGEGEGGGLEDLLAQEPLSLWCAAHRGNRPAVEAFVKREGADVNEVFNGTTPLYRAADGGYTDVVKVLVESRADVNVCHLGDNGVTPLYVASLHGHTDIVRMLIGANADTNSATTDDGKTPLRMAAQFGHTDIVRMLLDASADANQAKTTDGQTPLFKASDNGHTNIVRMLLSANADANLAKTDSGTTPLIVAARNGHTDAMRLLINAGANVHATSFRSETALSAAEKRGKHKAAALLRAMGAL